MATNPSGQPKTLMAAELDLLSDEGEAWGRAVEEVGKAVRIRRVIAALQAFIVLPRFFRLLREADEMVNAFFSDHPVSGDPPGGEKSR